VLEYGFGSVGIHVSRYDKFVEEAQAEALWSRRVAE
jgi:hypothetical protein